LGYRVSTIVLPLLALQQTGSTWAVGLIGGAAGLPVITAPWWSGLLQRRLRSAAALGKLMAAEGIAALVVPSAAGIGRLTPAVMVAAGLLIGVLTAVSGPLNATLLAEEGDRRDLRHAAAGAGIRTGVGAARLLAVQETVVKVAMTVAPLVALPLVGLLGACWTVAVEGCLTLVAAAGVATVRGSAAARSGDERPRVRAVLLRHREIAIGWAIRGAGCAAWFAFTLGLTILGEDEGVGVLLATVGLASYSAGAVVGSVLGTLTAASTRPALVNSLSWFVAGLGWTAMGCRPSVVVVGVAAALMGLVVPAGNAATTAMVTRSTSGLERRAALTAQTTVVTGATTLGLLAGGPIIALAGPRAAVLGVGVVLATLAAAAVVGEYSRDRGVRTDRTVLPPGKVPDGRERDSRRELSRL
jgi:hypothetical protein